MSKHTIRWANVLFLTVLLANLVLPPGAVQRALADDPPSQPTEGPLSGHFIAATWVDIHNTLFGAAPAGEETAFYLTTAVIKGIGRYWGVNNVGRPFVLDVIRHYHITDTKFSEEMSNSRLEQIAATRQQTGLVWARMSTSLGHVNVIAASMADASPTTTSNVAFQGIVPLINHDALMDFYVPSNPNVWPSTLQFHMMAEGWDPNAQNAFDEPDWNISPSEWIWSTNSSLDGGLLPCATAHCPGGGWYEWCSGNDPAVQRALLDLAACIGNCAIELAAYLTIAVLGLVDGTKLCWAVATPITIGACLGFFLSASLLAYVLVLLEFELCVAACMADFFGRYNAAAEAAYAAGCNGS